MDLFDLSNNTAVIMGGSSTLGSAMALALSKYGAKIALVGRNADSLTAIKTKIKNTGGSAEFFLTDVTSQEQINQCASEIVSWSGSVDILINSIGTNSSTSFWELEMEEFDYIMNINLKTVILACQTFGRIMMSGGKGGSIVNISSVSSGPPLSKVFAYSASKAALNNVTQYLAREFAPHDIRVNAVIPGFFLAVQNNKILTPERKKAIIEHTPLNRFGVPEDLQGVILWLASEKASSFVTGSLIHVDGGFSSVTI